MLFVPAPALWEIVLTDLFGNPVYDGVYNDRAKDGDLFGKPKPSVQTYQNFLLARLTDEGFFEHGGEKKGHDALELLMLTKRQVVDNCARRAAFQGYDDEVARRLQHAIRSPKQGHLSGLLFEHNWYDWSCDWKQLHQTPPAVLVTPEPVDGMTEAP